MKFLSELSETTALELQDNFEESEYFQRLSRTQTVNISGAAAPIEGCGPKCDRSMDR
jgi:hypothetical protein